MHVPVPDLREIVTEMRDAIEYFELLRKKPDPDPAKLVEAAVEVSHWADNLDGWCEEHGVYPEDVRTDGHWYAYGPRL